MKRFMFSLVMFFVFMGAASTEGFAKQNTTVQQLIRSLEVGMPVHYQGLTIVPIYNRAFNWYSSYTTLDEALRHNWIEITEIDSAGAVPEVRMNNLSGRFIYIMGGEIISGGKQDRIVARDVLIAPQSYDVKVPVYCVEQGRWQHTSEKFYSKDNLGFAKMRSYAQTSDRAHQGSIWNEVERTNSGFGVRSHTNSYQEVYESPTIRRQCRVYTDYFEGAAQLKSGTIGVVIAVGGRIVSVDIFANAQLFRKMWPKILKSSVVSALANNHYRTITQDQAADFLSTLYEKNYHRAHAVDAGFELRCNDYQVNANALVYNNTIIHLAAFPEDHRSYKHERGYNRYRVHEEEYRVPVMRNR